jgi:hypothetical protein
MSIGAEKHVSEHRPLLPTTSADGKLDDRPHKLLGIACVALSAVCFSLMSTMIKFNTYTMTSIEAIFWRSIVAMTLNYVRLIHTNLFFDNVS